MSFHIFGFKLVSLKRIFFFFTKPKKAATGVDNLLRSRHTRWNTLPSRATLTSQVRIKYVIKFDVIFFNLVTKSCLHFFYQ